MVGGLRVKLLAAAKRSWASLSARRMLADRSGAAAVEFAMVAAPFLALVFAIMETAIVFFAGQALETAGADSARLIMTGQAQTQGFSQLQFKQAVCARIYALFSCDASLNVDVKSYPSFATVDVSKPLDGNGNVKPGAFNMGCAGDIVVVRLTYQWPVYVSLLGLNLADSAGSKRLLMSTVAFRNEPYGSSCAPPSP